MTPRELTASLNPSQRDAATTVEGPLLVLAGAGTGKTRVITTRMALLINRGTAADRILSVTFTNKAAKEMAERIGELIGRRKVKPIISTFHSLCVKILRDEIEVLGYRKNFTIIDRGDQESLAREVLRSIRVQESTLKPGDLLAILSRWKTNGVQPESAGDHALDDREFLASMAYRKYCDRLRARNSVDFDDLLLLTDQLFAKHPEALKRQQDKFDYVQIDEYQDTNQLQFRLIQALVRPHNNLCVVGDDDQSIYAWRGAEVKHILSFQSHFPTAKIVRLEDNYRCTDEILNVANRLVSFNRERHRKVLRSTKIAIEPVRYEKFSDEVAEAERICLEISYLIAKKNRQPSDFAILFRTNEQPRAFESELRRRQIPYVILGSQSFFDRKEIRDLMAYMRIIAQPRDESALLRIINTPARSIGTTTIEKIMKRSIIEGTPFFEATRKAIASGELSERAGQSVLRFEEQLQTWRGMFASSNQSIGQSLRKLIESLNYKAEVERSYKEPAQVQTRLESIEQLADSLDDYTRRVAKPRLQAFLDEIALNDRDEFGTDKKKELDQNAVKLLTIHSAKGLEFPRVYLVGMEEGLLPHKRSVEGTRQDIEEERRLAYVGVTRAQESLTLTFAETRRKWGKPRKTVPSRFLFEMRSDKQNEEAVEGE
ncbi:UvrD-helicase domain-containing protein [Rubinisphaera sp.]|uniref:ATP-dependent helicase n=1 Tax=Rubinisphaera sp. TaxID=2024857 RepID=UPI000C0E6418|nr:UvrD-helicase domain-containing protein [Rubinisphaera sp.]MBV09844.1 AAA family ATPase [Rubinisphaera sp.]|tara:strand:- start:10307 stop:12280 length:1974 start_codon:yes stop_codon:yes gene_type:complete